MESTSLIRVVSILFILIRIIGLKFTTNWRKNMYIIDFENIDVAYDNIDSYKDRDIDSNYKENIVLKDINLKIEEGSHWAILGANGSGKSTLLKLILSEIHPRATKEFKKEIMGLKRYSIFELKKYLGVITNDLHNYFLQNASYMSGFEVVLWIL